MNAEASLQKDEPNKKIAKLVEDCFFFIDMEQPEETRCMSVLCVECHDMHMPDTGWFHPGSTEGYGPFVYQCCQCQKIIHQPKSKGMNEQK